MGPARTLWEKVAAPGPDPFGHFEDGLQVPLDAVLPDHRCARLASFFDGADPLRADPWSDAGWAFPAARLLESDRVRVGARVASSDPHATELGALGIAAFHHPPAPLLARAREGFDRVNHPRRTLVRLNDPPPPHLDATDVALRLLREAGPAGFANAVLHVGGDGWLRLDVAARRRLLALVGSTGCVTALGDLDVEVVASWSRHGWRAPPTLAALQALRDDADAVHDELVIVNGSDLEPLVQIPTRGVLAHVRAVAGRPVDRVVLGGCVGGDLDTLRLAVDAFERRPPACEAWLVPASERLHEEAIASGLASRAESAGARVAPPRGLGATTGLTVSSTSCLAPAALVGGISTCLATAAAGRLWPPGETLP